MLSREGKKYINAICHMFFIVVIHHLDGNGSDGADDDGSGGVDPDFSGSNKIFLAKFLWLICF